MMKCSKTGLTDNDWKTILDVINVFDPNDIAHVYPEMAKPEFMQDVQSAFKAVLAHVERNNLPKSHGGMQVPQYGPETIKNDHVVKALGGQMQTVNPVACQIDNETFFGQSLLQVIGQPQVVFDQKQFH